MLFELVAALDLQALWWWIDVIVKVAIALGAVVFVHELGHFLMAKACGVKVEKFMLGFDIGGYKIAKRFGETVYGIGILPLGGYVKMFGQDDDPSHIAEQMQKSQVDANSSDAVAKTGPNGETYYIDPRSYLAKSVPQRMAIISAGVVMNIIFAFIFAVIAYGLGVKYVPCVVSGTIPGSSAWKLGLAPGDEIVRLGERQNPTFLQLRGGVTLGDMEAGIPIEVRLASTGEVVNKTLLPMQESGELATVGISGPLSLKLAEREPVIKGSAAAGAKLVSPGKPGDDADRNKLRTGDVVVSVNDVPVENYAQYIAAMAGLADQPLKLGVQRKLTAANSGSDAKSSGEAEQTEVLTFEVAPQPMHTLGLVMKMGPVTAVQVGSPAEQAGIKAGDVIEKIDGQAIVASADAGEGWTPLTLPHYLSNAGQQGRAVEFTLRRGATGKSAGEELTVSVSPVAPKTIHTMTPIGAPVASDAAGIAYRVTNEVHAVLPMGPAAESKIEPGDRIVEARILFPPDEEGNVPDAVPVTLGPEQWNWPALVDALQFSQPGTKVELRYVRGEEQEPRKTVVVPQASEKVHIAPRGLVFEPVFRERQAASLSEAVRYGFDETIEALTMVFRFLQKLGSQVPLTMLGGPGTIAVAAGDAASQGLSSLLIFLTMLSANLAVINFLPIPLLDGGHMVFLLYEGLRGRPANERFVLAMHMAGFVFIISLMLFVIGLDIQRFL